MITGAPYGPGACGNAAPCVYYINPKSFALPAFGDFGNMGKGALRFPGQMGWDMGFFKNFPLHGERVRLQFRGSDQLKPVQFVDLLGSEHGSFLLWGKPGHFTRRLLLARRRSGRF